MQALVLLHTQSHQTSLHLRRRVKGVPLYVCDKAVGVLSYIKMC